MNCEFEYSDSIIAFWRFIAAMLAKMDLQLLRVVKIFFLKFKILDFDPCLKKSTLKLFLDHFWPQNKKNCQI